MNRQTGQTLGDLLGIAVAIWFLTAERFAELSANRLIAGIAGAVILLSLWRIFRRWRAPR
ncbi:MAG: hypothetical protein WBA67_14910 [Jannaschia sp.]